MTFWIILSVVVLVLLILAVSYNRFISQRALVQESWKQIDVELQRRHDLIPNLLAAVKGYMAHEASVLAAVTEARAQAQGHSTDAPAARQAPEGELSRALGKLFAVAEAYPDLKASANFLQLQEEIAETENRIAAGRRFYNGNVRAYNTRVQSVPSNVVAGMFRFKLADYFEIEDPEVREVPTVSF